MLPRGYIWIKLLIMCFSSCYKMSNRCKALSFYGAKFTKLNINNAHSTPHHFWFPKHHVQMKKCSAELKSRILKHETRLAQKLAPSGLSYISVNLNALWNFHTYSGYAVHTFTCIPCLCKIRSKVLVSQLSLQIQRQSSTLSSFMLLRKPWTPTPQRLRR